MSLSYQMDLTVQVKAPGILRVAPVDHEYKRRHVALRRGCKRDASQGFKVDGGYLLAFAQIRHGGLAVRRRHPIRNAPTGAATVEAKHETRPFRSAAMNEGIHA